MVMERLLRELGQRRRGARHGERAGQAQRHFTGKTGAGQHAVAGVIETAGGGELFAHHLVRQRIGAGLEALAQPEHAQAPGLARGQPARHFAQARDRRGDDHQAIRLDIGMRRGPIEIGLHREPPGQRHAGQVGGIDAVGADAGQLGSVPPPQHHIVGRGGMAGERGAPGTRTEDCDFHGGSPRLFGPAHSSRLRGPERQNGAEAPSLQLTTAGSVTSLAAIGHHDAAVAALHGFSFFHRGLQALFV